MEALATNTTKSIYSTPMGPYAGIMQNMDIKDKEIVLYFLLDSMKGAARKSNADIIKEKFSRLKISAETKSLINGLAVEKEDLTDEKTRYILGVQ